MTRSIVVARDFTRSPGGRTVDDGPYSGERFREELLVPALNEEGDLEIDLRGALTFGSSFLDEAFGGLVRAHRFSPTDLRRRIRIRSDLQTYVTKIWSYVDDAGRHEGVH